MRRAARFRAMASIALGVALLAACPAEAQRPLALAGKSEVTAQFDTNGDGWLDATERQAARDALRMGASYRRWRGDMGPDAVSVPAGPRIAPSEVRSYGNEPLFSLTALRTVFIDFAEPDWEQELADFYRTDVDVAAQVSVDGRRYHNVGVHFRGNTSYQMVAAGHKRSLDLSFDMAERGQTLLGYHKLELLNAAADPTFLRTALYMHIMRAYVPAPQVNYMRVVINGENWGIYVNEEHLSPELTRDAVGTRDSMRWKIPGSPRSRGGLEYLGEDPGIYRRVYEIKSKDRPESWAALIRLCKLLNTTPAERLPAALAPLLDIDGTLRFLAVEKALMNNDGYWTRASDYSLYTDASGRFHLAPHDANETLRPLESAWRWGGSAESMAGSTELDPLEGVLDPGKPLLYRMLAVPEWRERYLAYVRDVADRWLDWEKLGPLARRYQAVIAADIPRDTRKLFSTESFALAVTHDDVVHDIGGPIAAPDLSLMHFAQLRREYLMRRIAAPAAITATPP